MDKHRRRKVAEGCKQLKFHLPGTAQHGCGFEFCYLILRGSVLCPLSCDGTVACVKQSSRDMLEPGSKNLLKDPNTPPRKKKKERKTDGLSFETKGLENSDALDSRFQLGAGPFPNLCVCVCVSACVCVCVKVVEISQCVQTRGSAPYGKCFRWRLPPERAVLSQTCGHSFACHKLGWSTCFACDSGQVSVDLAGWQGR